MSRVGIAHHHSAITVGGAHPTATFPWSFVSPIGAHDSSLLYPSVFNIYSHVRQCRCLGVMAHNRYCLFLFFSKSSEKLQNLPSGCCVKRSRRARHWHTRGW